MWYIGLKKLAQRLLPVVVMVFSIDVLASQDVIADDGREVRLNKDGTWSYLSDDRFATDKDGKRLRLKTDGSWSYTGDKSAAKAVVSDLKYVPEQAIEISVQEAVFETMRGKKSVSQKGSSKKTRMSITLNITADKSAKKAFAMTLNSSDITVEDTDGRVYPILSVSPQSVSVAPKDEVTILIRADGSPHWFTTKEMTITLSKKVLSSRKDLVLSRPISSFKKINVESFNP